MIDVGSFGLRRRHGMLQRQAGQEAPKVDWGTVFTVVLSVVVAGGAMKGLEWLSGDSGGQQSMPIMFTENQRNVASTALASQGIGGFPWVAPNIIDDPSAHKGDQAIISRLNTPVAAAQTPPTPPTPAPQSPQVITPAREFTAGPIWTPPADAKWLELAPHPSVGAIIGKRDAGKSTLGCRQLELKRDLSRVPGSGVIRGRGSGERETTASSLAGKEESSRKEDNSGQGKDGPAGAIAQGGNRR